MNDSSVHTGICIVMPATHLGSVPMSHCTVAFLGNTEYVDFTKRTAQHIVDKLASMDLWLPDNRIATYNTGYEMFGVEKDQPVAVLERDERILDVREKAEQLLNDYGIEFSKLWDYKPHVSLFDSPEVKIPGLLEIEFLMRISLRPPVLWWGDDRPLSVVNRRPYHV